MPGKGHAALPIAGSHDAREPYEATRSGAPAGGVAALGPPRRVRASGDKWWFIAAAASGAALGSAVGAWLAVGLVGNYAQEWPRVGPDLPRAILTIALTFGFMIVGASATALLVRRSSPRRPTAAVALAVAMGTALIAIGASSWKKAMVAAPGVFLFLLRLLSRDFVDGEVAVAAYDTTTVILSEVGFDGELSNVNRSGLHFMVEIRVRDGGPVGLLLVRYYHQDWVPSNDTIWVARAAVVSPGGRATLYYTNPDNGTMDVLLDNGLKLRQASGAGALVSFAVRWSHSEDFSLRGGETPSASIEDDFQENPPFSRYVWLTN